MSAYRNFFVVVVALVIALLALLVLTTACAPVKKVYNKVDTTIRKVIP
jgi:hypothetical protein